mmetsp:Transcript_45837/g.96218  ORF Transcript_45837/g.96218 Transcript_45837/m.96218 type:complete len:340 (+) Transcript_45837:684-1703(+)
MLHYLRKGQILQVAKLRPSAMDRGGGAIRRNPHGQRVAIERGIVRAAARRRREDLVGDLVAPEEEEASAQRGQVDALRFRPRWFAIVVVVAAVEDDAQFSPVAVPVIRVQVQDARELASVPRRQSLGIVNVQRILRSSRTRHGELRIERRRRQVDVRRRPLSVQRPRQCLEQRGHVRDQIGRAVVVPPVRLEGVHPVLVEPQGLAVDDPLRPGLLVPTLRPQGDRLPSHGQDGVAGDEVAVRAVMSSNGQTLGHRRRRIEDGFLQPLDVKNKLYLIGGRRGEGAELQRRSSRRRPLEMERARAGGFIEARRTDTTATDRRHRMPTPHYPVQYSPAQWRC